MTTRKALPPEGLWISPDGDRIPVIEHLITIQHEPVLFGFKAGELRGFSVEDLRELAEALIKSGWVRFRHFGTSYNFEVDNARRRIGVIESVLADLDVFEGERVYISQVSPRKDLVGTVADVFDRKILGYYENPGKNRWRFS